MSWFDNQASNQPVLVQPADNATGIALSPTLEVTVSDPNADVMNVTFYGRAAGGGTGEDFRIVVFPDTQNESQYYPAVYTSQTTWIVNNKISQNIVFATHVGDIVNTSSSTTQWGNADTAMDILDTGNVSYSVGPGNHDLGGLYNNYFGIDRFSGKTYYGGYYGSDNYNNYSLFSTSGRDFILINLQYNPTTAMLDWADALLKQYSTRRGIVVSHSILNIDNSFTSEGTTIFNALKDNANLFLMLCGHMHSASDGAAYLAQLGDDGHTIHIMEADYQEYPSGGNGYLRILRFSPHDDKIYATTYSPYISAYITSSPDQMEMAYDMAGSAAFEVIGMANGVASGSNASINWTGLSNNTRYDWYAVANDGITSTTSSTWGFTTIQNTYTLSVSKSGTGSGTVTSNPAGINCGSFCSASYIYSTSVTLAAAASTGSTFTGWSGSGCSGTGTCTVTMTAATSVTATFNTTDYKDIIVYRSGAWMKYNFASGSKVGDVWTGMPTSTCIPAPMDYDGDGVKEYTQLCGGAWHFYNDDGTYNKGIWVGDVAGQRPVPGDYNGDGTDEVVLFRGGAWLYYNFTSGLYTGGVWTGAPVYNGTPIPVPMDYNGDGKMEPTVDSGGPWHFFNADGSYNKGIWTGWVSGDLPVPGDYNGDGTDEVVIFRGGAWLNYDFASGLYTGGVWTGAPAWNGTPAGTPLPAPLDYNGDGKLEYTVYSGGPWHFFNANGSYNKGIWIGYAAGDLPISRRYLP